jgi:mono/diheme cytochrome c family protein
VADAPIPNDDALHARRRGAWLVLALGGAALGLAVVASLYRPPLPPPDADISGDPWLVRGHDLYQTRCVSCHGARGKGDGPIAASIRNPPPGDLTDGLWKHGEAPDDVLRVVAQGVPNTNMAGWSGTFSETDLRAVTAYVLHLAGRPVPDALRVGPPPPAPEPPEDDEG